LQYEITLLKLSTSREYLLRQQTGLTLQSGKIVFDMQRNFGRMAQEEIKAPIIVSPMELVSDGSDTEDVLY
jgi:hypothetical protein